MVGMQLRRCNLEDLKEVDKVEKASFSKPFTYQMFSLFLKNYPEGFIVAEDRGKIVGYIIYSVFGDKAMIVSIGVLPEYRRRGTGQILLEYTLNTLRSKVRSVELQVSLSNSTAIRLYQKNGFIIVDVIPRYYPDGKDAYLMKKTFT